MAQLERVVTRVKGQDRRTLVSEARRQDRSLMDLAAELLTDRAELIRSERRAAKAAK